MKKLLHFVCLFLLCVGSVSATVLDTLYTLPRGEGMKLAREIFSDEVFMLDSAEALPVLDQFLAVAIDQKDPVLEALALSFKGQYFAYRIVNGLTSGEVFLRQAVDVSEKHGPITETAYISNQLGYLLCYKMNYREGLEYLLKSDYMMQQIGYEKIPWIEACMYRIARVYFDFENYEKAIHYVNEVLNYTDSLNRRRYAAYNLLGIIYAEMEQKEMAVVPLEESMKLALKFSDSSAIGSVMANLGILRTELGDTLTGKELLKKSYDLNMRHQKYRSANAALMMMVEINIEQNELEAARNNAKKVRSFLNLYEIGVNEPKSLATYYELKSDLHKKENNFELATIYMDSMLQIDDSIRKKRDIRLFSNLSVQIETEKHLADIRLLEKDNQLQSLIRNVISGASILVILVLMRLWFFAVRKRKKERREFIEEQEKAKLELESFKSRVQENNLLIENFRTQLEHFGNRNGNGNGHLNGGQ